MFALVGRVIKGCSRVMYKDGSYFAVQVGTDGTRRPSRFREDVRGAVGGALAFAMVGAAVGSAVDIPAVSDSNIALILTFVGGIVGKLSVVHGG